MKQRERLQPFVSTPAIPPEVIPPKVRRLEFATPELDEPDDFGLVAQEASSNFGPSPAHALLAGGAAGVISRTITAPLDRLKVMLQASDITVKHQYTSLSETGRAILKQGGVRAFWRGNGVNVIKAAPEMAVRFYTFERLLDALGAADSDMTGEGLLRRAAAGASAGAIAQFVVYPLETTKTRLAVSSVNEYRGMIHCLVSCTSYEGWRSLYRGLSASLAGIIPYAAVDLTIYSTLRELADARYEEFGGTPPLVTFGIGAVSTSVGQIFSYPLQLVRTRLQAQGMKGRAVVYKGIFDCMAQTVHHGGLLGLYKGMLPNMLKSLPAMSISYTVYEQVKAFLAAQ
jgi:solute carrier family 25 phosphate transporter 23/24/25/41